MEGSERGDHLGGWTSLFSRLDYSPSSSPSLSHSHLLNRNPHHHVLTPLRLNKIHPPNLFCFITYHTRREDLLAWLVCLLARLLDIQDTLFATFDSIHPPNVRGDIDGYTTTYVLILLQQHYKTTRCSFLSFFLFCTFPHNKPFFALSWLLTLDSWLLSFVICFDFRVLLMGCVWLVLVWVLSASWDIIVSYGYAFLYYFLCRVWIDNWSIE